MCCINHFELVTFEVEVEENVGKTFVFNCKVFSLYMHSSELLQAMLKTFVCFFITSVREKLHFLSHLAVAFY